jgi:hypothetical protein
MSEDIRQKYETLEELLESERTAFKEQDVQKLAALVPQIRKCSRDVADLAARFSELSLKEIEQTRDLILSIQKKLALSRESWRLYQSQLELQRRQLQSSRRFCHQAKMRQRTRGSRISHSA